MCSYIKILRAAKNIDGIGNYCDDSELLARNVNSQMQADLGILIFKNMPENYFTIPKNLDPCSRKHCRATPLVKQIEKYDGLFGKGKFVIDAPHAGKLLLQSRA